MTFADVAAYLDRMEGTRSRNELVKTLAELYTRTSPDEIQPVTYLIQGRLVPFFEPVEMGMGEKLVMASIAQASGRPVAEVNELFNTLGDLGLVAEKLSTGSPAKTPSIADAHSRLMEIAASAGPGSVEKKRTVFASLLHDLDARSAKHLVRMALGRLRLGLGDPTVLEALSFAKKGDRSLRPSLEAAYNRTSDLGLIAKTFWTEGEAIGYNPESEEYVMFQQTASRRRQHGIEEAAASLPLVAFVFDVLYRNGKDLTPLPYGERYALLGEVLGGSTVLTPAPLTTTSSAEELTKTLLDNISKGLEGVVVKRMDSPYQAGARNFNWVKLKRTTSGQLNDTVDLVLLGYYFGKGKRTSFGLGALLAGVYDTEHDRFDTITKIGTGLSDAGWREIHERADKLQVKERPARVRSLLTPDVWLKPEVVVEVLADEITPGTNHTAGKVGDGPGYALRFPRIVSFRAADKRPEDATTVKEIVEMFQQQGRRKVSP